jgi:hypothetical protein
MVRPQHIGEVTPSKPGAGASGASTPKPHAVLQQRDRLTDINMGAFWQHLGPVLVDRIDSARIARAGRGFGLPG